MLYLRTEMYFAMKFAKIWEEFGILQRSMFDKLRHRRLQIRKTWQKTHYDI